MPNAELTTIFEQFNVNSLIQMASFLGVLPQKQRNKTVVLSRVIERVQDPAYVRSAIGSLSPGERAALDAISRRDGKASLQSLRAELSRLKLIDPKARVEFGEYYVQYRPKPELKDSKRLEDIVARLMMRGLVFADTATSPSYSYQTKRTFYDRVDNLYIPSFVKPYLPEPEPLPDTRVRVEVNSTQESSARLFQRDLYLYWGYIRDHKVTLTMKGEIAKAALKEINAILQVKETIQTGKTENDYPRLRFLRSMLEALKLIQQVRYGELEASSSTEFFSLSPDERVRQTFEAWKTTEHFSDLLLLPAESRPKSTSNPLTPAKPPVIKARRFITDQFAKLVKGVGVQHWAGLESLVDTIYMLNYEFFLKRTISQPYYSSSYTLNPYDYSNNDLMLTFPGILREEEGWQKVEANLIRGVVTGPLHWMGLVDLGFQKEDQPAAFRLTALGAWVFDLGPKPEIRVEGGRVIVQPNLHVMALDPILDSVLATLDRFAERLSAERAVEYRITRASVYSAQLAGWDVDRIKAVLQQYSGSDLPGNVARTLEEWQAQFERITIRPKVVLAHGLPEVLDRVVEDQNTSNVVKSRPLPELALLANPQAVSKVVKRLQKEEIVPYVSRQAEVPAGSITASENGELRFTTQVASLYLHGHLVAFADPMEETDRGYRITPASVQRGVRAGLTADEIINSLEAVNSGPLPEKLLRSIRAWSGHFGSASMESVTLLQMRDAATLAELLTDPEIAPLLKPYRPKQPQALARVKPENVEKLKALLAERGVDLEDL